MQQQQPADGAAAADDGAANGAAKKEVGSGESAVGGLSRKLLGVRYLASKFCFVLAYHGH